MTTHKIAKAYAPYFLQKLASVGTNGLINVFNGRRLKTVSCNIFGLYYIATRQKASTTMVRRAETVIIFQRVLRHTFACRGRVSTRGRVMAFRHRQDAGARRVLLDAGRAKQFGSASARLSYD